MPLATGPKPACVTNPTLANCTTFKLPHSVLQGDLNNLCKAMHFMTACSIYKACRAAAALPDDVVGAFTAKVSSNPEVCRRMHLVSTVCVHDTGMGKMAGCQSHFNSMCAQGTRVPTCLSFKGFPQLPTTKALNQAVKQLCSAKRTRPGCAPCLQSYDANKTYGNCDLLGVWGDICVAEPKLPQCANHTAICSKDKSWFFCQGGATAKTTLGWKLLNQTLMSAAKPPMAMGAMPSAAPANGAAMHSGNMHMLTASSPAPKDAAASAVPAAATKPAASGSGAASLVNSAALLLVALCTAWISA